MSTAISTRPRRHGVRRRLTRIVRILAAVLTAALWLTTGVSAALAAPQACADLSEVACENLNPGTPAAIWDDFTGAGDPTLQGFATDISVNVGERVDFKVKSTAAAYQVAIYRLGWYQGNGARKIDDVTPSAPLPQVQPACITDPATNLVDCGNWSVSASWQVPSAAVSGVYLAVLTRPDTGGASHIPFVVRNDASRSAVVYQTSDPTWQAYNDYGGSDFYIAPVAVAAGQARALKISYNRPLATRAGVEARDYLMSNEYSMIRFLERNGYDLSYIAGVDTDRHGSLLTNHRVFLSVGHDEYWSAAQRANVEAARDAGVNLAFFSGNEVYWQTRYEPSVDGTNTPYRTLVSYKETWSNAKIDPSGTWTGTFRDPRFGATTRPENALTGTAYMSNHTDLALKVPAEQGKYRIWRNTSVASLASGQVATLAPNTVGYESNEDLDNGYRPAGLVRMSTTTGSAPQYLTDFGSTVSPGTTTHHITMYRAASGARVFSAGTIQWSFGLDDQHDVPGGAISVPMQQATVNLLADMDAQPTTLMTALSPATKTSDVTAPTVTITSPGPSTIASGSRITVAGTATDVGGVVGAVEVSTDGGLTFHPAQGTSSWTFTGVVSGTSNDAIKVRAADDSANLSTPVSAALLGVTCPCSLFGDAIPATPDTNDGSGVELGVGFMSSVNGWVTGIRFYKGVGNTGTHTGTLWSTTGTQLATGTFVGETATGWQTMAFDAPVPISANTRYVASYFAPKGHYASAGGATPGSFWYGDVRSGPLTAPGATTSVGNGSFLSGQGFPTHSYDATNYYVDVVFYDRDVFPPKVSSASPLPNSSSNRTANLPKAVFSKDIDLGTLAMTMTVAGPGGASVTGQVGYDSASRTATFQPTSALDVGTMYTVTVAAADAAGNAMAPWSWSFRTADADRQPNNCPCSLWNDSYVPQITGDSDAASVELGVKFTPTVDGVVTGVRFYKNPANLGTHTGSLWSATGTRMATGTFAAESTQGWQTLTFAAPVSVTAGTTYVASYLAPQGRYAVDPGLLASEYVFSPLKTITNGGLYLYGTGGFPKNSSSASYVVTPVFTVPPGVKPVVTRTNPIDGETNVRVDRTVTVSFSTLVVPGSPVLALATGAGSPVAGSTSFDSSSQQAVFTPSAPLSAGTIYRLTISGAASLGGTAMDPATSTFVTAGETACPCTTMSSAATPAVVDSGDGGAVSLGLRFTPTVPGSVTGVRFYKSTANTGTHSGSLWNASGQRLATGTFVGETAAGWQTLTFAQPVQVTVGQTYTAAYFAPAGHYSTTSGDVAAGWTNGPLQVPGGSNGTYAYGSDTFPAASYGSTNYWVDPVFVSATADTTAPAVLSRAPAPGATNVAHSSAVTVTFSEPIDAAALSLTLTGPTGSSVPGTVSYAPATRTATLTPSAALTADTSYTVSVQAKDLADNAMPGPDTWTFTTVAAAPVVTGLTATAAGGNLTISWATDVSATTQLAYGTSATSLIYTASGDSGTTHAVTFPMTPNTRYFYRVTSANLAAPVSVTTTPAPSEAPSSYAPPVTPFVVDSAAELRLGTVSKTTVATDGNGRVILAPAYLNEFATGTLGSGLATSVAATGGTVGYSNGLINLTGMRISRTTSSAMGSSVVFNAQLETSDQQLGWYSTGVYPTLAAFGRDSSGALIALVDDGASNRRTIPITAPVAPGAHTYRVDLANGGTTFFVDDVQVAASGFTPMATSFKVTAVDGTVVNGPLSIDWVRVAPYATSGTYTSRVIDAGASVVWDAVTAVSALPTSTGLTLKVRSGNTATPGTGWTTWRIVSASGQISLVGRYVQVQLAPTTTATFVTPEVDKFTVGYHLS